MKVLSFLKIALSLEFFFFSLEALIAFLRRDTWIAWQLKMEGSCGLLWQFVKP